MGSGIKPTLICEEPKKVKAALAEQTVTIAGTTTAETILPRLAKNLQEILTTRKDIAHHIESLLEAHPLSQVLTSMPGVGASTAAQMLVNIGNFHDFKTPGHLASYAGLAPVTRRSGSSIRGEHPSRFSQPPTQERPVPFRFRSPQSRPNFKGVTQDRKREQGKRHNAALICPARRRCDVLYAMLRDGTLYQPSPAQAADKQHRDTPGHVQQWH